MDINIRITDGGFDNMTWNDMIAVQNMKGGNVDYAFLQELILPFMVDDDQKPLKADEARRRLGELNIGQISDVLDTFSAGVNDFLSQRQSANSVISGSPKAVTPRRGQKRSTSRKSGGARRG